MTTDKPAPADYERAREAVVIAKCIGCGHRREIRAGEVPKGQMPECPKCYSVMVAERAEVR